MKKTLYTILFALSTLLVCDAQSLNERHAVGGNSKNNHSAGRRELEIQAENRFIYQAAAGRAKQIALAAQQQVAATEASLAKTPNEQLAAILKSQKATAQLREQEAQAAQARSNAAFSAANTYQSLYRTPAKSR